MFDFVVEACIFHREPRGTGPEGASRTREAKQRINTQLKESLRQLVI